MAGHFNFRNDGDVPRRRISHDFADVVLRVKSAVAAVRAVSRRRICRQAEADAVAPRADTGQLGIFFDFDAPAVVVHQMPVERVDLVQRHRVEQLFSTSALVKKWRLTSSIKPRQPKRGRSVI